MALKYPCGQTLDPNHPYPNLRPRPSLDGGPSLVETPVGSPSRLSTIQPCARLMIQNVTLRSRRCRNSSECLIVLSPTNFINCSKSDRGRGMLVQEAFPQPSHTIHISGRPVLCGGRELKVAVSPPFVLPNHFIESHISTIDACNISRPQRNFDL